MPEPGTIYINVPNAFERAETDLATFLERHLEVVQSDLTLNEFIQNGTSRKEIEETVLPEIQSSYKVFNLREARYKIPGST